MSLLDVEHPYSIQVYFLTSPKSAEYLMTEIRFYINLVSMLFLLKRLVIERQSRVITLKMAMSPVKRQC